MDLTPHLPAIEQLTWDNPSTDNWCAESVEKVSDYLKGQGIPHTQVGTPEDTQFPYGHHDWIQLDDGTVLDPTITQFGIRDFPGTDKTAVIPPDHPMHGMYTQDPNPSSYRVAAPQPDPTLDQPGDLTLPTGWTQGPSGPGV